MSDDDDFSDKGKKTNASPTHKPQDSQQFDVAPTGSVGRKPPGLSLGSNTTRRLPTKSLEQGKSEQAKDERPIAVDSDDPQVNADSDAKGYRRLTMEQIKAEAHGQAERDDGRPQITQSDYAKAFRRAHDNTRQMYKDKGHERD